jgi:hypothetical protein
MRSSKIQLRTKQQSSSRYRTDKACVFLAKMMVDFMVAGMDGTGGARSPKVCCRRAEKISARHQHCNEIVMGWTIKTNHFQAERIKSTDL